MKVIKPPFTLPAGDGVAGTLNEQYPSIVTSSLLQVSWAQIISNVFTYWTQASSDNFEEMPAIFHEMRLSVRVLGFLTIKASPAVLLVTSD